MATLSRIDGGGAGRVKGNSPKPSRTQSSTPKGGGTASNAGQTASAPSSQPLTFGPRGAGPALPPYPQLLTQQGSSGGSGGGGGYGGSGIMDLGGGGGGGMAPSVSAPTEEDYLAGDAGYQTQLSALQGALQRFLADSDFQRSNYNTDYGKSLRDLGYDEDTKQWNWNDRLTASGRGYQNQLDDFASRNMLQSQGYADAYQELLRMLNQQYDSMAGARNTFMTDLDNQTANYKAENLANQQAARAEALQRRASQFLL